MAKPMTKGEREVLLSYRDRMLAYPNYSGGERAYYCEDFLDPDSLAYIMSEIFVGESDITETGIQFLKEFRGHEKLAHLLVGNKNYLYKLNEPQTVERLGRLVPNELSDWLEEIGAFKK